MNVLDNIYYINRDSRTDRRAEAEMQFTKHGLSFTRVQAIEGETYKASSKIDPGNTGCLQSHIFILKLAKRMGLPCVTIFEDDVEFADDFISQLKHIPDRWDMLYYGGSDVSTVIKLNEHISTLTGTYMTHAYSVKENVYDFLLNKLVLIDAPVDVIYSRIHSEINTIGFRPHIAWQRESYSDIVRKNVNYKSTRNEPNPNKEW